MNLKRNQAGLGIIGLLLVLGVIAMIAYYTIDRLSTKGDETINSPSEVIDQATDSVDKANEASQRANDLLENN